MCGNDAVYFLTKCYTLDKKKGRSERRNELKKILSIIAVLAVLLMGTVPAMAYNGYFADDGIWAEIPDGWDYSEDIYDQDDFRHIASVYNDESSYDIWYCNDNGYDYSQFYSEEEAIDYFETYGNLILLDFLNEQGYGDISYYDPSYVQGDYTDFVKVKVETDDGKEYVYMTCYGDESVSILYMHPNGHKINPDAIAKGYYDYSYTENNTDSVFDDIPGIDDLVDFALPAIAILIGLVSVIRSLLGKEKSEKKSTVPVREESKRVVKRIRSREEAHHEKDTQDGVKQTAYTGCTYEDSLRTLYKSGLLTRQQLNEMLEKHNGGK